VLYTYLEYRYTLFQNVVDMYVNIVMGR